MLTVCLSGCLVIIFSLFYSPQCKVYKKALTNPALVSRSYFSLNSVPIRTQMLKEKHKRHVSSTEMSRYHYRSSAECRVDIYHRWLLIASLHPFFSLLFYNNCLITAFTYPERAGRFGIMFLVFKRDFFSPSHENKKAPHLCNALEQCWVRLFVLEIYTDCSHVYSRYSPQMA